VLRPNQIKERHAFKLLEGSHSVPRRVLSYKVLVIALLILSMVIVSLLIARCPTGPNRFPGRGVGDLVVFLIVRPG